MRAWRATGAMATAALVACVPLAAGADAPRPSRAQGTATAPVVEQLVAFRSGRVVGGKLRARAVTVRVGRRRCAVGAATPLASLVRARPGRLRIRDYGSCSPRARDAGGLYVRSIGSEHGRGQNGWVYKVGHTLATAGAGDPAGPFGRGRLRAHQRVTWFFCLYRRGCQRTLALRASVIAAGRVAVRVRGYDDDARGVAVSGARVSGGGRSGTTDAAGTAQLQLPPGRYTVRAAKPGLVRSFGERVVVP